MIRRQDNGEFVLIAQGDHAQLAGKLAAHVGNAQFAPPLPHGPTVLAVSHHDDGWAEHDAAPTLNAQGLPVDVFETPLPLALAAWRRSSDRAEEWGDYTALLVSLHGLGLSAIPASREHTAREIFELNKFQHYEIERQVRLRQHLGLRTDIPLQLGVAECGTDVSEDHLMFNIRLLQSMDHLSLAILCRDYGKAPAMMFERIDSLVARPGRQPTGLTLSTAGNGTLVVSPWPFDVGRMTFEVPCRRVPARVFADAGELRKRCAAARVESLMVTVRAP